MKKWMIALTVIAAVGSTQAATIEFNEAIYQTAGDGANLVSTADWSAQNGNILANTATTGDVGFNGSWDRSTYNAESFSAANIGDSMTTSMQFYFTQNAVNVDALKGNAWQVQLGSTLGTGNTSTLFGGFFGRSWNNTDDGKFSVGIGNASDATKTVFDGVDIGVTGLTDQSDLLEFSSTVTRGAGDTYNLVLSIKNLDTGTFSTTFEQTGIALGASTDLDTLYGAFKSQAGGSSVEGRTMTQFEVTAIPEPATIGLVVAFGGGILFIRHKFMM